VFLKLVNNANERRLYGTPGQFAGCCYRQCRVAGTLLAVDDAFLCAAALEKVHVAVEGGEVSSSDEVEGLHDDGGLGRLFVNVVESDGDEEVRIARRSVVKEVETALEGVETKVKRAREVAKDNSEPDEDHAESDAGTKTEEEEDSASISSHTPAASYSSLAPVSAPEVDAASFVADFVDVVPDNSATEDISSEETTEVVAEPTSSTSAATVQDEVARIYTSDVPESTDNAIAGQSAHDTPTSETREEAVSASHEDFILTSAPVSPAFPSPTLAEDVSASGMSALPIPEGEVAGPDDAEEDEWSEVEA